MSVALTVLCILYFGLFFSLVPYREKSSAAVVPQSRVDNAAEFVVARLDDLVNWARRVSIFSCYSFLHKRLYSIFVTFVLVNSWKVSS